MEISKAFPHVKQNKSWICKLSSEWHFIWTSRTVLYWHIIICTPHHKTVEKKLRNMKPVFLKRANPPQERISRMPSKESRGEEGDLASVQSSQSQRFFSEVWSFFKSYSDLHQSSVWNFSVMRFFFLAKNGHFGQGSRTSSSEILESLKL